jgi:hypothetical protein
VHVRGLVASLSIQARDAAPANARLHMPVSCACTAPLQELALAGIAGGNGAEAGAAAVLHAACGSRHLQLLDLRGLPLHGEV